MNGATRVSLALGSIAAVANGLQAQPYAMPFQVPFAFQAPGMTLPPGKYLVEKNRDGWIPDLKDVKTGHSLYVRSSQPEVAPKSVGKLVFHRYGTRYFLAEIWSSGGTRTVVSRTPAEEAFLSGNPGKMTIVCVKVDRVD